MAQTEAQITAILQALESHVAASGWFERVNRHEPKNAPGNGLTAAIWVQALRPVALASGLDATAALLLANIRLYSPMMAEPQDEIDPNLTGATSALVGSISGDFTLGGLIRNVDLLGAHGTPLSAEAGYLEQDRKLFRVYTITVPLVANDVWSQSP